MGTRRRRSDWSGRGVSRSPGRPGVARREDRRRFWTAIAAGGSRGGAAGGGGGGAGGRGGWGGGVVGGGGTMVPGGGRHATIDAGAVVEAALGAVPVVRGTRGGRAVACAGARGAGGRPTARAGGVDDLARAAAQRCDAGRRPGVSTLNAGSPERL